MLFINVVFASHSFIKDPSCRVMMGNLPHSLSTTVHSDLVNGSPVIEKKLIAGITEWVFQRKINKT